MQFSVLFTRMLLASIFTGDKRVDQGAVGHCNSERIGEIIVNPTIRGTSFRARTIAVINKSV
jgi:hypothetical protein